MKYLILKDLICTDNDSSFDRRSPNENYGKDIMIADKGDFVKFNKNSREEYHFTTKYGNFFFTKEQFYHRIFNEFMIAIDNEAN